MMNTALLLIVCLIIAAETFGSEAVVVKELPTDGSSDFHVFNRPPLLPNPLAKLPIGSITPNGWLKGQLELMKDGMTGHLDEFSEFITPESGWWSGKNRGWEEKAYWLSGWEEMPYWLKGFGDLGYILDDRDIKVRARKWLDAAIASQEDDGYFGPPANKAKKDLWPNMVMLFAFQSLYEATGDKRVIPLMTKYFRYQNNLPIEDLIPESWQKIRAGDNLESVYWLYNRTGEPWLLDLGKKLHERTADWTNGIPTNHGVNFCQSFRQPGVFYQQSRDKKHLDAVERNYAEMMGEYGRMPGGMFGADENRRPGKTGPQQAAETCSIVEFMYSDESLLTITGDPKYADRCEDVAFNSFPPSMTPDLKALHYLTAPNQVSCDKGDHCYQNKGTMVSYSPHDYRCCQHNVAQGWPYYAEHLWMATKGNGLAAVLYAASEVKAKVGNGAEVRIVEDTDYPFDEQVEFTVHSSKPVEFPLALRIPGWCKDARVTLNGRKLDLKTKPASYVVLNRQWQDGDKVSLELPMAIEVKTWEKQNGGVSVSRGPLSYSLKIGEKWQKYLSDEALGGHSLGDVPLAKSDGGTDEWPEWEILPMTPWNYGLVLGSFEVAKRQPVTKQPFTPEAAPITLRAQARRVPEWTLEMNCPGPLPKSPVAGDGPVEEVELIPMGCARLRISVFPVTR